MAERGIQFTQEFETQARFDREDAAQLRQPISQSLSSVLQGGGILLSDKPSTRSAEDIDNMIESLSPPRGYHGGAADTIASQSSHFLLT